MPHHNRAILADITEKGLNPAVAHKAGPDGKLFAKAEEPFQAVVTVVEEQPESNVGAEEVVLEEKIVKEPESIQVEVPKKKSNRFKKKSQDS